MMAKIADISGVDSGALDLKNLMDGVLARIIAVFEQYNAPVPARAFWMFGDPAVESEQLCVALIQMYLGMPGDEAHIPQRGNALRSAVLSVQISRIVPIGANDGSAPAAADIQKAAEVSAVDAWLLMESCSSLDQWGDVGDFGMGVIVTLEAPVQQGDYQTTKMQVTMAVP